MAIRILSWNVQFFTANKLTDIRTGAYITSTLRKLHPDIFVLIELRSSAGNGTGSLYNNQVSGTGIDRILDKLRLYFGNTWMVVPPVVLNFPYSQNGNAAYSEAIAVFFDSAKVAFTGPLKWGGAAFGGIPINPPMGMTDHLSQNYPAGWNGTLPTTNPGDGATDMDGSLIPQSRRAGQAQYFNGNQAINFPEWWSRTPFLTTFREVANARTIKLMSVHLPPGGGTNTRRAVARLAAIPEMAAANNGANEVRVIVGDFNINANDANQNACYSHLTNGAATVPNETAVSAAQYTNEFPGPDGTMLRGTGRASVQAQAANLPIGYQKYDKPKGVLLSLDNALVHYCNGGAAANKAIIDRVDGYPNPPFDTDMEQSLDDILNLALANQDPTFRQPGNYGKIRSASDHMAITLDV